MKQNLRLRVLSTPITLTILLTLVSLAPLSFGQQSKPAPDVPVLQAGHEDPYKKGQSDPNAQDYSAYGPAQVSFQFELFSLSLTDAAALMREPISDGERLKRVISMVGEGKARQERLVVTRTKSGQRMVAESIDEVRYANQWGIIDGSPENGKKDGKETPPASNGSTPKDQVSNSSIFASNVETRNIGETIEIEPVIGPDGVTIDLNLVPQVVRYAGERVLKSANPVEQPLFETQKVTTSLTLQAGKTMLLGTCNPPFGTGLSKDDAAHQIWLQFITPYLITPEGTIYEAAAAGKAANEPRNNSQAASPKKP
jgi:hypothetical protein